MIGSWRMLKPGPGLSGYHRITVMNVTINLTLIDCWCLPEREKGQWGVSLIKMVMLCLRGYLIPDKSRNQTAVLVIMMLVRKLVSLSFSFFLLSYGFNPVFFFSFVEKDNKNNNNTFYVKNDLIVVGLREILPQTNKYCKGLLKWLLAAVKTSIKAVIQMCVHTGLRGKDISTVLQKAIAAAHQFGKSSL